MNPEPKLRRRWLCRDKVFDLGGGRPLVMGVLNVTPDSFSDGGRFPDAAAAIDCGLAMLDDGADIIDVGGRSTRPGSLDIPVAEELARVVPVVEGLVRRTGGRVAVSVDTMQPGVALKALEAGADIINDVSGFSSRDMIEAVAKDDAGAIVMHMRGMPVDMQENPVYSDVVTEVHGFLVERALRLVESGVNACRIAIDPGIGFGKRLEHNLALIAGTGHFAGAGYPVVMGLSRKSFLGALTGRNTGERLAGSLAGLVYCALKGADVLRVHDVRESVDALKVTEALARIERDLDVSSMV